MLEFEFEFEENLRGRYKIEDLRRGSMRMGWVCSKEVLEPGDGLDLGWDRRGRGLIEFS